MADREGFVPRVGPAAVLPDGVEEVPAEPASSTRRQRKGEGPKAVMPDHVGPEAPDGGVATAMVFMIGVAVVVLTGGPNAGGIVLAVLLLLAGGSGLYAWVRTWRAYRRSWSFKKRVPLSRSLSGLRGVWSDQVKQWRHEGERARAESRQAAGRPGRKARRR